MTDDNVVDLDARRPEPPQPSVTWEMLNAARSIYDQTHARLSAAREEHGPVADRFSKYRRAVAEAHFNGLPVPDPDPDLEVAGAAAIEVIEREFQPWRSAQLQLSKTIAAMVRERVFTVGEKVPTPFSKTPLIVAWKNEPPLDVPEAERELCEVTLTEDGGLVVARQHNWQLDPDGKKIDDGTEPVRYERWWSVGLRVAGTVHPISRRIIDTDDATGG